jgi:dihydrofolate reductase
MRKIKLLSLVSIDGYASRTNGEMDWVTTAGMDPMDLAECSSFFDTIDCVVMNRTQHLLLQFHDFVWPTHDKSYVVLMRKGAPPIRPISAIERMEIVLTDDECGKNELYYIRELQKKPGDGAIWVMGDYRLTAVLLQHDMVDEMNILRLPITLGSGVSFLSGFGTEHRWELHYVSNYPNGVILTCYHRTDAA